MCDDVWKEGYPKLRGEKDIGKGEKLGTGAGGNGPVLGSAWTRCRRNAAQSLGSRGGAGIHDIRGPYACTTVPGSRARQHFGFYILVPGTLTPDDVR